MSEINIPENNRLKSANNLFDQRGWRRGRWIFVIILIVIIIFVPVVLLTLLGVEKTSKLGESFIIVQSIFDGIACFAVILTLLLEINTHKKEAEAQQFQSVFFPYLTIFQSYVENLECGSLQGRRIFSEWNKFLGDSYEENRIRELHDDYEHVIECYHKHLRVLLEFIEQSHIPNAEKTKYINLLHAQLSEEELFILLKYYRYSILHNVFRYESEGVRIKRVVRQLINAEIKAELINLLVDTDSPKR